MKYSCGYFPWNGSEIERFPNTYGIKETWITIKSKGGNFAAEFFQISFATSIKFSQKYRIFLDFRKNKFLMKLFFQNVRFHLSKRHLWQSWRAQIIPVVGGCLVLLSTKRIISESKTSSLFLIPNSISISKRWNFPFHTTFCIICLFWRLACNMQKLTKFRRYSFIGIAIFETSFAA